MARLGFGLRRLLWSPALWSATALVGVTAERWGWAVPAFLLALFTYVARTAERVPQYGLDHALTVESDEFRDSLAGLAGTPFLGGNTLTILNNGKAFYPAMLEAIADARQSITMEAYIYWDGEIGREFATALAERSRHGVSVKLLLDAVGSTPIGAGVLADLERAQCQLAWFNPLRWWSLDKVNNRTHRKSLIVDGKIAFTGGAGIADHWRGDAESTAHWRDLMVRVQGPAAIPLQTGFAQNWLETTCEVISGPRFFPDVGPSGDLAVQTVLSSPGTGASVARITYFLALASARRSIIIANPYFVPDAVALRLIADATARGVKVDIVVAGRHNDNWLARRISVRLYGRLLDVGARVFEYNRTMLHYKTMVVDSRWATVGTTNFDNRSFAHNEESNVCFMDRERVGELETVMRRDLAQSDPIDRKQWARRGVFLRSQEVLASLLEYQV